MNKCIRVCQFHLEPLNVIVLFLFWLKMWSCCDEMLRKKCVYMKINIIIDFFLNLYKHSIHLLSFLEIYLKLKKLVHYFLLFYEAVVYCKLVIKLLHEMSGLTANRFLHCSCRKWESKLFTRREKLGHCLFIAGLSLFEPLTRLPCRQVKWGL